MKIDFSAIKLEIIDLCVNYAPDMFVNQKGVSFSKRLLEDLGYPQFVQYCVDPQNKIFAVRVCKGSEAKATAFSKPKNEQLKHVSCSNKNLRDTIFALIPNGLNNQRYKITGEYDGENRVMYFDMTTAQIQNYHKTSNK